MDCRVNYFLYKEENDNFRERLIQIYKDRINKGLRKLLLACVWINLKQFSQIKMIDVQ